MYEFSFNVILSILMIKCQLNSNYFVKIASQGKSAIIIAHTEP